MSLTWAPGRQQTFPQIGSRRESPVTITNFLLLAEAFFRCGGGHNNPPHGDTIVWRKLLLESLHLPAKPIAIFSSLALQTP